VDEKLTCAVAKFVSKKVERNKTVRMAVSRKRMGVLLAGVYYLDNSELRLFACDVTKMST
jgi:hypothetical protein